MAGTDVETPARWEQVFAAEAASVGPIRRGVAAFARAHGASEERLAEVTLAVSEAATNAVVHAFAHSGRAGTLAVHAEARDDALHVVVADDGHGMKPRGDSPGLGLGLPTIAQLTERMDIRAGRDGVGTEVHMVFAAPGMRAPAAEPEGWRIEVLAGVTALTGSSWPREGVDRLVDLLVPTAADACTLDLVEAAGPRRVAARLADGLDAGGELSRWLASRAPLQDAMRSALPSLRSGEVHVMRLDDEPEHPDRMGRLDLRWWVNVPLTEGGMLLGALGLGLRADRADPHADVAFYATIGERAARGLGSSHLVDELRRTRRRLERILSALSEAVTVQDASGQIVYANDAAAALLGAPSPADVRATTPDELAGRFDITREDGSAVTLEDLPGWQVLAGAEGAELLTRSVLRRTGAERWLLTKATRFEDDEPLAVNIIEDITEAKNAELRRRVLAQVGETLATRPDPRAALARIAALAVPSLADWCAIDVGDRRVAEAGAAEQPRSALAVPVRVGERPIGMLRLATRTGGRMLDAERRAFAEELAGRLATAAQRAA